MEWQDEVHAPCVDGGPGQAPLIGRCLILGKDHPALPLHFLHANKPTTSHSGQDDDQCTMAVAESDRSKKLIGVKPKASYSINLNKGDRAIRVCIN